MKSRMYKSGQKPAVGDKVVCKDFTTTSGWNSRTYSVATGKEYTVSNVSEGSKSTLITINGEYGEVSMKADRFELVSPKAASSSGPSKYIIVDKAGKVVGAPRSDTALSNKLSELLLKDPSAQFHVFGYVSTAKTQKPKVEFFTAEMPSALAAEAMTADGDTFRKV